MRHANDLHATQRLRLEQASFSVAKLSNNGLQTSGADEADDAFWDARSESPSPVAQSSHAASPPGQHFEMLAAPGTSTPPHGNPRGPDVQLRPPMPAPQTSQLASAVFQQMQVRCP